MLFAENAVKTWVLLVIGENQGVSMNRIKLTMPDNVLINIDMDKVLNVSKFDAKDGAVLFTSLNPDLQGIQVKESVKEVLKLEQEGRIANKEETKDLKQYIRDSIDKLKSN
jgi:hypothetical protein